MADSQFVIQAHGIRNQFGSTVVHNGLNLDVKRREVMGLVGGSGTGKSVLLNTIVGLRKPQAGSIRVLGLNPYDPSPDLRRQVQKRWGVLFQDGALFSGLTVSENIQVPLRENTKLPISLIEQIARAKIAMVGLAPDACNKLPSELSGGMRKRAGLARALAMDPEILFLDEPTAGLDPIGASSFDNLIESLRKSLNLTVLMVTHDLDSLNAICDRIAVLLNKRVT
ncbi:MAG: ATP-binding cassette domain-containing protein, partial [Pseudomonadota bacterium]